MAVYGGEAAWRQYLRPEFLMRLQSLELRARYVVEGFLVGIHRSPYHGFSVEFAEHRQYHPGDEPRLIDWKVYARTDRFYVKQFEEETNVRTLIALDCSASMGFQYESSLSKWGYAALCVAALTYLLLRQKDAVGLALYNTGVQVYRPPSARASQFREIVQLLEETEPTGRTHIATALSQLAERLRRRSLVVLCSDFLDAVDESVAALRRLRAQNHEVIALQILEPVERTLEIARAADFQDLETAERMPIHPYFLRNDYRHAFEQHQRQLATGCAEHGIDFFSIDTTTPFDRVLRQYLAKRRRM
ncbi:MAG: DUF58 domain-containing protein [Candidatus Kapabacteria bacterium]|nr:DUF58 domain-containing protein [Candidatus Kapabacteria bacterium]MCS7169846.1 DUF58 domain-containing protein [Candidatus Kapabacteria bacterium]MDW7997474.1 DUF58 domain-containing protein [Bacteroidota bacterium]MDW8225010.1 DUF58 domain-containing protein [Bacteroidota bacterium]